MAGSRYSFTGTGRNKNASPLESRRPPNVPEHEATTAVDLALILAATGVLLALVLAAL
jgi:hypothetical protein